MNKRDHDLEWKKSRLEFVKKNDGINKSAIPVKSRRIYDAWVEEGLLSKRIEGDETIYEYVEIQEDSSNQES